MVNSLQAFQYMIKVREAQELYYSTRPRFAGVEPGLNEIATGIPEPQFPSDSTRNTSSGGPTQGARYTYYEDGTTISINYFEWFWEWNGFEWEGWASHLLITEYKNGRTATRYSDDLRTVFAVGCSCGPGNLVASENFRKDEFGTKSETPLFGVVGYTSIMPPSQFNGLVHFNPYRSFKVVPSDLSSCPAACFLIFPDRWRKRPKTPPPPVQYRKITHNGNTYPGHFIKSDDKVNAEKWLNGVGSMTNVTPEITGTRGPKSATYGDFIPPPDAYPPSLVE